MSPPPEADGLEQLLHRCHRDEVLPLARLVGVPDVDRMGLADLARNSARGLRRLGAHQLANATLRGGEGPPYEAVIGGLLAKTGQDAWAVARTEGVEAMEVAVVRHHFTSNWDRLSPAARAVMWERLGVPAPAPASGVAAAEAAERSLGGAFAYTLTRTLHSQARPGGLLAFGFLMLHPIGCLLRVALLPVLPFAIWYLLRKDETRLLAGVLEVARLRQVVLHRVTIGVVGSPSTGKDAAIKALFGVETGNISPIAGSTREVSIQQVAGSTALYLVNTPGMGDVVERVTEEARQVLDHIDIYLYLVNAEGGVQARELADYQRCVRTGKPVLAVVNKIDVLRPRDKERYLADARAKLGAAEEDFIAAAFDPLPQLAPGPIHREEVDAWLRAHLAELGKDPAELPPLPPWKPRLPLDGAEPSAS